MANQANVKVRNVFSNQSVVNVKRRLKDGTVDLDEKITGRNEKQIQLPDTDVELVLELSKRTDLRDCLLKVKSDVDLQTLYSRTDGHWLIKIIDNNLPPDSPTTVNIDVGSDEPD